ncbi:MAG TPA: lipid II flippase MurJ, partial [Gaiellaceae bacterium]|nr:lipid II flippase MurJ [Gaiellaceae bacterium]
MSEGGQARRLARSTATFTLATGLSRALGLVREIVAAYFFGVSGKINAFTVASQIPSLTRAFVGDAALSGAFVPVFSELLAKEEKARAWRVASTIFWLVLIGVSLLTAVLILIAPLLILPFGDPGGDPELAVQLTRIMLPIVGLVTLSGIVVGILNAYDQFTIPALAPVAWNLVIIGGLVAFVPLVEGESEQLIVYAVATLVAALVQLLLPVPWL